MHFRVDGTDFEITEETQVELARGDFNVLTLVRNGAVHFRWVYKPPIIEPPLDMDPTPFVEEEDFDFGVFVYNVIKDTGRTDRIYTGEAQSS